MKKCNCLHKKTLILSLVILFTMSVPSTLAFIVTGSDSVTNTFIPDVLPSSDDVSLPIYIHKTVKNLGTLSIGPENFAFVLQNTQTGEEIYQKTDNDGRASFELVFTEEDVGKTFVYTLAEINDGRKNITYDATTYEIEITVGQNDANMLSLAINMNDEATESVLATFVNTYHANKPVPAPTGDSQTLLSFVLAVVSLSTLISLLSRSRRTTCVK